MTPARLMVLAPFPPRMDGTHGGSRAVAQLLVRLAALHPLALLHLRASHEAPVDETLRDRCALVREVVLPGKGAGILNRCAHQVRAGSALLSGVPLWPARIRSTEFAAAVQSTVANWRPDILQIEYHVMGQYLEALGESPVRTVLRQHEPGAYAAWDRASRRRVVGRWAGALDAAMWRRFERDLMGRMDVVVALTDRDVAALQALAPRSRVVRIPLGVDLPARAADPAGTTIPPELLFIGNFGHPPNVDAAGRLAARILPSIRRVLPETRLTVVGPRPPISLQRRGGEGITITGEVPDVRPYLESAAVVVAPLRFGGGMRVKVAEALAAGKAVVASPVAIQGLEVTCGEHLMVAETDQEFVEACTMLLGSTSARAELAARAREWAVRHLGWDGPVAAFEELYASLLG